MKKIIYFLVLVLVAFGINLKAQSIWDGGGTTNNWSEAANWSGDVAPPVGLGADVVFNGTSTKDCNIDVTVSINDLSILSGYTGTIDGLGSAITLDNDFIQNTGTFISTSGVLEISGDFIFTGGTFTHGGGDITLYVGTAGNSITGTVTFNSLTIQTTAPSGGVERIMDFGSSATTNDLILTGGTKLFSYTGNITILNSLSIDGTSTGIPTTNSGTFTFSGAGPISITGSGAAARNKLPNVVMNTSGNLSMTGHVNVQGNWTGTQGTLTVGSSTQNFYGSSAVISGAAAAFDNLNIQSGASVTLPASEVLIGGTLTRTGTLTFQSGTILGLNGTGAQSISGSAITLGGIHAYPGSRTITMSTGVTILDFLQVDAGVTFASGGNVTLAASASQTARFAELGAGASVTGNVTVETFLPGGSTGWANLGVRGVTGQTVADWDTYVSSGGTNGIPMTCTLCSFNPTVLSTPFTSVQGWDEPTNGYVELIATDPMNPGVGRWVYVGDGQINTNDLKLINTGSLAQGSLFVPVSNAGPAGAFGEHYNLVANPYACPISASVMVGFGNNQFDFASSIYVWRADLNSGAGAYTSFNGITGDGQGQTDIIPGGQGFYISYDPLFGTGFLEFDESMKVSTNAPLLKSTSNDVEIVKLTLKGLTDDNTTVFMIHPEATPFFDRKLDAHKLFTTPGYVGYPGPYSNYTTLSSKDAFGEDYSIQSLPPLTSSVSIPVLAKVSTSGTYTISVTERIDFNNCLVLIDRLDNSYHDLGVSPYVFTISDTTSAPRFDLVLCKDDSYTPLGIASENLSSKSILISQDQQGAFVKTAFPQNTKATISVYNLVGQKLVDDIEVTGTATDTRLNLDLHNQVVFIRVLTDKETSTKKMVLR